MISLMLYGTCPSKKNAWRRPASGGKSYLPEQVQADIDALIIQAKAKRHRLDLKSIAGMKLWVGVVFYIKKPKPDTDNEFTTLLDVLQSAGIIENDRLVKSFSVCESEGSDLIHINIGPYKEFKLV